MIESNTIAVPKSWHAKKLTPAKQNQTIKVTDSQIHQLHHPEEPRILILNGSWTMPRNNYHLFSIIYLNATGIADGIMNWQAELVWGSNNHYTGTEYVKGHTTDHSLELNGYRVDPMLYPDQYRIQLDGQGNTGKFCGISHTCFKDWSGKLNGAYMFLCNH